MNRIYITVALTILVFLDLNAQVQGNGKRVTKDIAVEDIQTIDISLYAKTTIDYGGDEYLQITGDENLMDKIRKEVRNGRLILDQKEWIQPSQDFVIKIGAPSLKKLKQSTHDRTEIINFNGEKLTIDANTGKIFVKGEAEELIISVGVATVDASNCPAKYGKFLFESWGQIKADISENLISNSKDDGKLTLIAKPKSFNGNTQYNLESEKKEADASIRFIKFKIRNNSLNRNQFYVVGPKPDGSKFSYGFPMMPSQIRSKDWTNGTKVYKVNNLGMRKLVKTITLEDEGKTVDLFER